MPSVAFLRRLSSTERLTPCGLAAKPSELKNGVIARELNLLPHRAQMKTSIPNWPIEDAVSFAKLKI